MTYPEFREAIFETVQELLPDEVTTRLLEVEKLNSSLRHGILFTKENVPFSPTIYLEPYYQAFIKGEDISVLANELVRCYKEDTNDFPECVLNLVNFENAKDNIFAKLIHLKENENLLNITPHQVFLDFAIITYYQIDNSEVFHGTVLLNDKLVEHWKLTNEELLAWAIQNTKDKKKAQFNDIVKVLDSILTEEEIIIYHQSLNKMYVLTNEEKYFGSILIYFPEVLQKIRSLLEDDFYLLPASVHEWIIIPVTYAGDVPYMQHIVREINATELLPEEVLSDNVYLYDSELENILIC